MIAQSKNSTASILEYNGKFNCFIIEDGNRDVKVAGETRIDAGEYFLHKRFPTSTDWGGRHYERYNKNFGHDFSLRLWLDPDGTVDPINFTYIMVHIGNFIEDTDGCLLTNFGIQFNPSTGDFFGQKSTDAYKLLYRRMDDIWNKNPNQVVRWTIER